MIIFICIREIVSLDNFLFLYIVHLYSSLFKRLHQKFVQDELLLDMFMKHWLIFEKILQNWLMLIFYHFWNFCIKLCLLCVKLNDKFTMQWKKKFNSTKTKQNIDGRTKKKDKKLTLPFISKRIKGLITWLLWKVMV